MADDSRLVIENLSKRYGRHLAVKQMNISLQQGEIVGLLGPNGAGKTTCFYMIAGLIRADSGKILLDDEDITNFPVYQRSRIGIGYLPQETSIFRTMTVEDNIYAVLEVAHRHNSRQQNNQILERLLQEFSITHIRKSLGLSLSGGERRRVEIARALALEPKFILLDEPFAGVDPLAVSDIMQMVVHLKSLHIGVLITDHNVRETLKIVDRAYITYDGKVLKEGTPEEIKHDQTVQQLYLGNQYD